MKISTYTLWAHQMLSYPHFVEVAWKTPLMFSLDEMHPSSTFCSNSGPQTCHSKTNREAIQATNLKTHSNSEELDYYKTQQIEQDGPVKGCYYSVHYCDTNPVLPICSKHNKGSRSFKQEEQQYPLT
jgi:hypothetical protein